MTRTHPNLLRTFAAAAAVLGGLAFGGPVPVGAQEATCPATGLNLLPVSITDPEPGARVSGVVRVRGRADGALLLNQVELYAGGRLVDTRTFGAGSGVREFELSWDATGAPTGTTQLRVVACAGNLLGDVARGAAGIQVQVTAPATTTTAPVGGGGSGGGPGPGATSPTSVPASNSPTTLAPTSGVTGPGATGPGATTGATAPGAPTTTSANSSSTTAAPGDRRAEAPAAPASRRGQATEDELAGPARPGALTLTEGTPEDRPGPPLWVGIVVGLSGTIGLVLSAIFRRHHPAPVHEPVDEDDEVDADLVGV